MVNEVKISPQNHFIMKQLSLVLVFFFGSYHQVNAQVVTRILNERANFRDVVKNHIINRTVRHELAPPDVAAALAEDERIGKTIPRFAVKIKTNFTANDGEWFENDQTQNWKFTIFSDGATSINFLFKELHLPLDAEMYIYSANKRMIMGPITPKNIYNGYYVTDVIYGQEVTIEVVLSSFSRQEEFSIGIDYVSYGIKPNKFAPNFFRKFGASQPCNNDINCAVGNPWADVRDGVALILIYGEDLCTGSLVEDECNSGRPFFLTAFHCLDNGDGFLDNEEREYPEKAWSFRFFYESPNCGDTIDLTSWISFSGAEFKAGWEGTDFLLLELLDEPNIQYNQVNSGAVDDAIVACIHHPEGDVKKISLDNDPLVANGNFWLIDQWDDGVLEHGSSGGPLFDNDHLIIGQVEASLTGNLLCDATGGSQLGNYTFGMTNISWAGGGTDDTRLSTWLGDDTPPDSSDYLSVVGPDILCSGDTAFFCLSPFISVPNGVVNWTVSPSSWFNYPATGNNTCAKISVKNSFTGSGEATITFIGAIPYGICGSVLDTISYSFWVGKPDFTLEAESLVMCPRDRGIATIIPIGGFVNPDFNWSFTGAISGIGTTGVGKYTANYPGLGYICASVTNNCGTTLKCLTVLVEDCGRGDERRFCISPNPTNGKTLISLFREDFAENSNKTIKVIDQYSNVLLQISTTGLTMEVDMSILDSGVYIIFISDEFNISSKTFIKL